MKTRLLAVVGLSLFFMPVAVSFFLAAEYFLGQGLKQSPGAVAALIFGGPIFVVFAIFTLVPLAYFSVTGTAGVCIKLIRVIQQSRNLRKIVKTCYDVSRVAMV